MTKSSPHRLSCRAIGLCLCVAIHTAATCPALAAATENQPAPVAAPSDKPQSGHVTASTAASPVPPVGDDSSMHNAAARSRLNECGHQWSARKRNGSAVGTWKDFFKTCLARQ